MSKTINEAISEIQAQIASLEEEANKKRETVNTLCGVAGMAPIYEIASSTPTVAASFQSDEFYNKPLAWAVTKILEARKTRGLGAASADEIYNVMIAGGFKFESKNDAYAKRSMIIALSKNPKFHRLPKSDNWGLSDWYGVRSKGKTNGEKDSTSDRAGEEAVDDTTANE